MEMTRELQLCAAFHRQLVLESLLNVVSSKFVFFSVDFIHTGIVMEQFEQLLTCAICLDRYRIPKLLPCQHSFCMEPCMDGLVDYVRRQVKCPECRAEHRIPYQGVQGFPTNVTLQRFLELHIEITGELPDPTSGQVMERCNVCSEKSYCSLCVHCDKKICTDCKEAHMDILRREIARINNQVRRGLPRLQDALSMVEKNAQALALNCGTVEGEVDEIHRRLSKALKDRTDFLRSEIDRYLSTEARNLTTLKAHLEQEIANIQANCELADKHMTDTIDWDDCELMDAKDIFLKTVEFIRNFEYEACDYARRARFVMSADPNQLVLSVAGYGELAINMPQPFGGIGAPSGNAGTGGLQPPSGPGLMRSKSDHRLASQFRQQEEQYYARGNGETDGRVSPLMGRKFGERPQAGRDRYGRQSRDAEYEEFADEGGRRPSRYRSRFTRHLDNPDDDEGSGGRSVRFSEESPAAPAIPRKERERVLDTEDVSKGPLSGITRLYDSPRVMKRLQESETARTNKEKEPAKPAIPTPTAGAKNASAPVVQRKTSRQVSEEDEISKIKKQNKAETSTAASTTPVPAVEATRPAVDRVAAIREESRPQAPASTRRGSEVTASSEAEETEEDEDSITPKTAAKTTAATTARHSDSNSVSDTSDTRRTPATPSTAVRASSEEGSSEESSDDEEKKTTTPARVRGAAPTVPTPSATPAPPVEKPRFQSRFLANRAAAAAAAAAAEPKKESSDSESEEESSEEESEEEPASSTTQNAEIGSLLARSAQARDSYASRNNTGASSTRPAASRYESKYGSRARQEPEEEPSSRYSGYTSRFLNRSKSSAAISPEDEDGPTGGNLSTTRKYSTEDKYPSGRSRYGSTATGTSSASNASDLARSRSSHALKSRESSPERSSTGAGGTEKDGAALSSWARYLKNKYGNRKDKEGKGTSTAGSGGSSGSSGPPSSSAAARRLSLGLPLRNASLESSDDDQKNTPTSPTSPTAAAAGFGNIPRNQYLQKRRQQFKIGSRGSEPGCFTWPRGIAVAPDNSIVVADSSNHRVQVFDTNGIFVKEFGSYGSAEGEFDCLAGVAVNRIGQFIIADRYNHRIQVFQSDGTFVGKFGSAGSKPGQLEHPHYIAVSNTNRVIVSDSNNHRIQIFDVNGRVLTTFGTEGSEEGQFKFPRHVNITIKFHVMLLLFN
ncbi:hypothetical protein B566_EDAN008841 [Ephemera danica]|nr:hypothetical protein B566_EDAN008841 [Ephemera danica]